MFSELLAIKSPSEELIPRRYILENPIYHQPYKNINFNKFNNRFYWDIHIIVDKQEYISWY